MLVLVLVLVLASTSPRCLGWLGGHLRSADHPPFFFPRSLGAAGVPVVLSPRSSVDGAPSLLSVWRLAAGRWQGSTSPRAIPWGRQTRRNRRPVPGPKSPKDPETQESIKTLKKVYIPPCSVPGDIRSRWGG